MKRTTHKLNQHREHIHYHSLLCVVLCADECAECRDPNNPHQFEFDLATCATFSVPAFIYTAWNLINFYALLNVSLSTYSILYQTVILFNALLWTVTFRKSVLGIVPVQWFSLVILTIGVFLCHFKSDLTFHFEPQGLWVLVLAFVGATGSVSSEFVYKYRKETNFFLQNTYLYSFSSFFTFFYLLITEGPSVLKPAAFFRGFSGHVAAIITVGAFIGLSVGLILKHR